MQSACSLIHYTLDSPVGELRLCATDTQLTRIDFVHGRKITALPPEAQPVEAAADHSVLSAVAAQLAEYFAGRRQAFALPLAPQGTAFHLRGWEQLRLIPYGTTISYGLLADRLGQPTASRAVGLANGNNPLSIVVPCLRVIGANGSLTGFGGGIDTKRQLLELESPSLFRHSGPGQLV